MANWFLVMTIVILTGVVSGCQKKAAQEEASIPVEEAIDANSMGQEISQSDEMAAVTDSAAQTTASGVVDSAVNVAEAVVNAIPTAQEIQTALKNAGFYQGSIDGNIGPRTKQAIKDFQLKNSLAADGKVGPKTWKKLSSYLAQASTNTSSSVNETAQEITEVPAVQ